MNGFIRKNDFGLLTSDALDLGSRSLEISTGFWIMSNHIPQNFIKLDQYFSSNPINRQTRQINRDRQR